ncbi:unnamed protein product [Cuscuta europaea]|uniref:Uncharacterized protein n=1 Tax=Cuscuta europaea TaxID=41803 RepID=A0A9P0ZNE5_CUSEU|nr:unnamed protein product [Cuscuta europaea]
MGSNEQKVLDLKKQFEDCVESHTSVEENGQHIIQFPLPQGTVKEQIKLIISGENWMRIEWTPEGETEPFVKTLRNLLSENHDKDEITAMFVNGVLGIIQPPLKTHATLQHEIPSAAIVQNPPQPDTRQSTDKSDQNDETARRRAEEERDGGGGLEAGSKKSKSMGKEEESRTGGIPAAAATMTEAAGYYEVAKKLIRTHQRKILNVAVGLAILGISMYVIPGHRCRRRDY